MAAENFKVKKGLEVGTGITANSDGIDVTGIVSATTFSGAFSGDGSQLIGVTASGTGVLIKHDGSNVGVAGTINFSNNLDVTNVSVGVVTVTASTSGIPEVSSDLSPQLGGNLELNSKNITGTGNIDITGSIGISGTSTLTGQVGFGTHITLPDDAQIQLGIGTGGDFKIYHESKNNKSIIQESGAGALQLRGNQVHILTANGAQSMAEFAPGGASKLYHAGLQKLTTTSSGIEVPDLNVTGVGTLGKIETNGVTLGTNNNVFAAKFVANAVANFGTNDDLKISHDDANAIITNSTGDIAISGIVSTTSDIKVGSAITIGSVSGVITATSFSGSGVGLTSIPSSQLSGALPALDGSALLGVTASGTGVIIEHDGSAVGTAGTINFSTNLDVSPIHLGIVTVTASGGGSSNASTFTVTGNDSTDEIVYPIFVDGATGSQGAESDTNLTYNPNSNTLTAGTFSGDLSGTVNTAAQANITSLGTLSSLTVTGNITANGNIIGDDVTNISGINSVTATSFHGSGIGLTSLSAEKLSGTAAAINGSNITDLDADNLGVGTIPNGRFPTILPAVSGENLTTLNATEITSGNLPIARIADDAVTFAKMQNVGTGVFIGRDTSGTGDIETLTAAEARTLLNVADGATVGITTAKANVQVTWVITAPGSKYRFDGPGQDVGVDYPDLYLIRGQRYRFINNAHSSHPFKIRTAASGLDSDNYADGNPNNGSAQFDFNVQHDAPPRLYYQCGSHSNMKGNIYITGGANWRTTSVDTGTAEEIYVTSNVGIGTNNPDKRLHVVTTSAAATPLLLERTHDNNVAIEYKNSTSSMYAGLVGDALGWGVDEDENMGQSPMFIVRRDTGKIGIGHTNPGALLDIGGNTDGNIQAIMTRGNDASFQLQFRNETSSNSPNTTAGIFGLFYNNDNIVGMQFRRGTGVGPGSLAFTNKSVETLRIDSGGKVGIGTDDPDTKLHVDGTIKFRSDIGFSNPASISSKVRNHNITSDGSVITLDGEAVGSCSAIEYTIFMSNSGNIQSQKVLIMDDGIDAYIQVFAMMVNANLIATFTADVYSGEVRLRATAETGITGTITYKYTKLVIE